MPELHVSDFVAPRSHSQHNLRRTALSLGSFGSGPTQSNAPAPLAGLQRDWTLWQATGSVHHALSPFDVLCQRILDIVPDELHARTPLVIGSRLDVDEATAMIRGDDA